jgi:PiT family inorganic phosphate transporter
VPDISLGLGLVVLLILGAEFVNGWTDAPNAIATVVATRSLSPLQAVVMAAVLNLVGALSGTAVAHDREGYRSRKADLTTVAAPCWNHFVVHRGRSLGNSHE